MNMTTRFGITVGTALMAVLAMTGCSTIMPGAGGGDITGNWILTNAVDADGQLDATVAPVTLHVDKNGAGGTSACNLYGADVVHGDGSVSFTEIFGTYMYCEATGVMDLEHRYLTALGSVTAGQVAGDRLVLSGAGIELEFEAYEPDEEIVDPAVSEMVD